MPTNITDAKTFTATIVAPANGDPVDGDGQETLAQGLANRTAFLNDMTPYCHAKPSNPSAVGSNTLAALVRQKGGFSLVESDTAIKFPSPGTYEIRVSGLFKSTSTDNPTDILVRFQVGNIGDGYDDTGIPGVQCSRFTATNTWGVNASQCFTLAIADEDTEYLQFDLAGASIVSFDGQITIRQLVPPA